MKKITLFVLWFTSLNSSFSDESKAPPINIQTYPIRVVLYAGIDNNFRINTFPSEKNIILKATNGSIKVGISDMIIIRPNTEGLETINFYYKNKNGDEIKYPFSITYTVEKLPAAEIKIGTNNKISIDEIQDIKSFFVRIPNLQYYFEYNITQCKILIIKKSNKQIELNQNGNILNDEVKAEFQELQKDDIVILKDIKAIRADNNDKIEDVYGTYLIIQ